MPPIYKALIVVIVQTVYIGDVLGDKDTEVEQKNLDEEIGEPEPPAFG